MKNEKNHRSFRNRALALLLAFAMIFTMSGMQTLAGEVMPDEGTPAIEATEPSTPEVVEPEVEPTEEPTEPVVEEPTSGQDDVIAPVEEEEQSDVLAAPTDVKVKARFTSENVSMGSSTNLYVDVINSSSSKADVSFTLKGDLVPYLTISSTYTGEREIGGINCKVEIKTNEDGSKTFRYYDVPAGATISEGITMNIASHIPTTGDGFVAAVEKTSFVGGTWEEPDTTAGLYPSIKAKATNQTWNVNSVTASVPKDKTFYEGQSGTLTVGGAVTTSGYTASTPNVEYQHFLETVTFNGFKIKMSDISYPSDAWKVTSAQKVTVDGVEYATGMTYERKVTTSSSDYNSSINGTRSVSHTLSINNPVMDKDYSGTPGVTVKFEVDGDLLGDAVVSKVNNNGKENTVNMTKYATITGTQSKSTNGDYALLSDKTPGDKDDSSNVNIYNISGSFSSDTSTATYIAINGECKQTGASISTSADYIDYFKNSIKSLTVKQNGTKVDIATPTLTEVPGYGYVIKITDKSGNNLPNGAYDFSLEYKSQADLSKLLDEDGNGTPITFANKFYITTTATPTATTASVGGESVQLSGKFLPLKISQSDLEIKKTGTVTYGTGSNPSQMNYTLRVENKSFTDSYATVTDNWPSSVKFKSISGVQDCEVTITDSTGVSKKVLCTSDTLSCPEGIDPTKVTTITVDYLYIKASEGTESAGGEKEFTSISTAKLNLIGETTAETPFTVGNHAYLGNGQGSVERLVVKDVLRKTAYSDAACTKVMSESNPGSVGGTVYYKVEVDNRDTLGGVYVDHPFAIFEEPDESLTLVSASYSCNGKSSTINIADVKEELKESSDGKQYIVQEFPQQIIDANSTGVWTLEYKISENCSSSVVSNYVRAKVYIDEDGKQVGYDIPEASVDVPISGNQRANVDIVKHLGGYIAISDNVYSSGDSGDYAGGTYIDARTVAPIATDKVSVGDGVTYAIQVRNLSSAKTGQPDKAPIYSFTDTIPAGMEFCGITSGGVIGFTGASGPQTRFVALNSNKLYYTYTGKEDAAYNKNTWINDSISSKNDGVAGTVSASVSGNQVTFTITPASGSTLELDADQSVHFYILCKVTGEPENGVYVNKAQVKTADWAIEDNFDDSGKRVGNVDIDEDTAPLLTQADPFKPGLLKWIRQTKAGSYSSGTAGAAQDKTNKSAVVGTSDAIRYAVRVNNITGGMPSLKITDYIPSGYKYVPGTLVAVTDSSKGTETKMTEGISYVQNKDGEDVLTFECSSTVNSSVFKTRSSHSSFTFYYWVTPDTNSGKIAGKAEGYQSTNKVYVEFGRNFTNGYEYNKIWNDTDDERMTDNTLEAEAITYPLGGMGVLIDKQHSEFKNETSFTKDGPIYRLPGEEFVYELNASSAMSSDYSIESIKMTDTLPYIGDANGSQFNVTFANTGSDDVKVYLDGNEISSDYYTVTKTNTSGKYTFEITFTDGSNGFTGKYSSQLSSGKKISVRFPVIAGEGADKTAFNKYTLSYKAVLKGTDKTDISMDSNIVAEKLPSTTATIEAQKKVEETEQTLATLAGKFSFNIVAASAKDADGKSIAKKDIPVPATATATNDDKGKVSFGSVKFTKPGTYNYTITEADPGEGWIAEAGYSVTATVTVTQNDKGELESEVKYTSSDKKETNEFVNKEKPSPTTATIVAKKVISGTNAPSIDDTKIKGQFTFTLAPGTNTAGVTTPVPATADGLKATNSDGGQITFGSISFEKPGIYNYTITETAKTVQLDNGKVTTASGTKDVQVVVTKVTTGGKSTLSAVVNEGKDITITNPYTEAGDTTLAPKVTKKVSGITTDEKFTFKLTDGNTEGTTGYTMPAEAECEVQAAQNKTEEFGEIKFTKVGTYYFKINEVEPAVKTPGMTYDTTTYWAVVSVTNVDNALEATVKYGTDWKNPTDDQLEVTNTFVESGAVPAVKKVVSGTSSNPNEEFEFTLADANPANTEGYTMPSSSACVKKTTANNSVSFGEIKFTAEGDYFFSITETVPEEADRTPGMTYDATPKYARVNVYSESGKLKTAIYYGDAATVEGTQSAESYATVTNPVDDPDPTNVPVSVSKKIVDTTDAEVGEDVYAAATGKFTFTLSAADGNDTTGYTMPATVSATNTDGKTVSFGNITFKKTGTYTFNVNETAVSYEADDSVIDKSTETLTLTVVVTLNKDNTLTATPSWAGDNVTIKNVYRKAEEASAQLTVKKAVTPKSDPDNLLPKLADVAGKFTFTVTDANEAGTTGFTMPKTATATNAANGTVTFDAITFSKAGTYKFKITETDGKEDGWLYDLNPVEATVIVEKIDKEGVVSLEVKSVDYTKSAEINNIPTLPDPTTATVEVDKLIEVVGDKTTAEAPSLESVAGKFTFTLTEGASKTYLDREITTISADGLTATNDKDGHVKFDAITYKQAGTYYYTITETLPIYGSDGAVDESWSEITKAIYVKVDVTRSGDTLTAVPTYYEDAGYTTKYTKPEYKNGYEEPQDLNVAAVAVGKDIRKAEGAEGSFVPAVEGLTFEFGLYEDAECKKLAGSIVVDNVVENDGTNVEFKFSIPGSDFKTDTTKTYTFYLMEIDGGDAGFIYQQTPIKVEFTVNKVKDSTGLHLELKDNAVYYDGERGEAGKILTSIMNDSIPPVKTTADVAIDKSFVPASDDYTATLKAGDFEFKIEAVKATGVPNAATPEMDYVEADNASAKAEANMPMPAETTLTNDADGNVDFGSITYDREGVYTYKITETKGKNLSVGYSKEVVTVVVTVTRDKSNNKLSAAVAYTGNTGEGDHTFKNVYTKPDPADDQITLYKKLIDTATGEEITYNEKDAFHLFDAEDFKVNMKLESVTDADGNEIEVSDLEEILQSKLNAADGSFTFDSMNWTEGVGNSYDAESKTFTVDDHVSYPLTYTFVFSEAAGDKGQNPSVTYSADDIRVAVVVNKEAVEPVAEPEENGDGVSVTSKLTADHSVVEASKEEMPLDVDLGADGGSTDDDTAGEGTDEEFVTPDTFVNPYTAPESYKLKLEGTKTLVQSNKSISMKDGDFSFKVTPLDGAPGKEETVKNKADGTFTFSEIEISEDLFKTEADRVVYKYQIEEVKGSDSTITYDTGKVIATATFKKTGADGKSKIELDSITYTKDGKDVKKVEFKNTKAADGKKTVKTGDSTPIMALLALMATAFAAIVLLLRRRRIAK